jgi:hypothetical protein
LRTIRIAVRWAAARATVAAGTATRATPLPAAATTTSAAIARRVLNQVLGEFRQLGAIELSVAVGIESHRMRDHPLDRGWSTGAAGTSASSSPAATGAPWATCLSGTTASTTFAARTAPLFARAARTSGSTGTYRPAFFLRIASGSFATATAAFARASWTTLRMQLVFAQLSVAVLVELLERGGRIGDFFSRKLTVAIGIEHFHQRIARRTPSPSAFLGRTLAVVFVLAARRTFRGLGDNSSGAQGAQSSDDPKRATHKTISQ